MDNLINVDKGQKTYILLAPWVVGVLYIIFGDFIKVLPQWPGGFITGIILAVILSVVGYYTIGEKE